MSRFHSLVLLSAAVVFMLPVSWAGEALSDEHEGQKIVVHPGGLVLVCPHCAQAAGIGPGDLRVGARIATKGEVRALCIEAAKVIDY